MAVLVTLLAVVVALLGVLVAGLLRTHADILRALHDLGAGLDPDAPSVRPRSAAVPVRKGEDGATRAATDLSGVTPDGDAIAVGVAKVEHPSLVAFLTTGCTTCADFWSAFADLERRRVPGDARLVVVLKGAEAESVPRARKLAPPDVPVVMSSPAWDAYDVPVAPYFVMVDGPTGEVVGEGAAATWDQLTTMMARALEEAGLDRRPGRRRRRGNADRERAARADRELTEAGIDPEDSSLYPSRQRG